MKCENWSCENEWELREMSLVVAQTMTMKLVSAVEDICEQHFGKDNTDPVLQDIVADMAVEYLYKASIAH